MRHVSFQLISSPVSPSATLRVDSPDCCLLHDKTHYPNETPDDAQRLYRPSIRPTRRNEGQYEARRKRGQGRGSPRLPPPAQASTPSWNKTSEVWRRDQLTRSGGNSLVRCDHHPWSCEAVSVSRGALSTMVYQSGVTTYESSLRGLQFQLAGITTTLKIKYFVCAHWTRKPLSR
jgi:hypothetical protein